MFAYIDLCRENLVDKIGCFGTSSNVGVESGIRISRLKTQFAVIRFDPKHGGDRINVNIPGYDVNNVTKSRSPTKFLYPILLLLLLHLIPTFMWGRCMMTYASV